MMQWRKAVIFVALLFSFQEHMVLCRFADQTAVQLPPERRRIGMLIYRAAVV